MNAYAVVLHVLLICSFKQETLKMMGMSSFVYWFSWFFKGFVYLIITLFIVVIIFQAGPNKIFDFSDSSLLFFFLLSYAVSVVAFSFLLSSFFNKGKKKQKQTCMFLRTCDTVFTLDNTSREDFLICAVCDCTSGCSRFSL